MLSLRKPGSPAPQWRPQPVEALFGQARRQMSSVERMYALIYAFRCTRHYIQLSFDCSRPPLAFDPEDFHDWAQQQTATTRQLAGFILQVWSGPNPRFELARSVDVPRLLLELSEADQIVFHQFVAYPFAC